MKFKSIVYLGVAAWLFNFSSLQAQPTNTVASRWDWLQHLVQQTHDKVEAGKNTEPDFAAELKSFDELIAAEREAKTDEAAQTIYIEAMLYLEVFRDYKKAGDMMKQITDSYPKSIYGKSAGILVTNINAMMAGVNVQGEQEAKQVAQFPIGQRPDDFDEKDLAGKPISLAAHKGKVLLIDFWATWCPGCVVELPDIIATYQRHHDEGFDVISVSHDTSREELENFMKKQRGMTWPQYFDTNGPENKLALKYGVQIIPFAVLLDRDGKVITTDLRGDKLEAAVTAALKKDNPTASPLQPATPPAH